MKNIKYSWIFLFLLAAAGCSKSYFDVNNNPNEATAATPELVLPTVLVTTAAVPIVLYPFSSAWMGYWAPAGGYAINATDISSYNQTTDFGNPAWINLYNILQDANFVEQLAKAQGKPFYQAAAKVMKAYNFQQLVDMFNNVPYSQAFQGTTVIQPGYDKGQAIYESLSAQLDSAVTLFKRGDAIGAASSDVLFAADNAKWIKFANTLRLRLLIHQSEMSGRTAYIQAEIAKIVANGGGFLTADAGVNPGYKASTNQQNPFWGLNYNTSGTYINGYWRAAKYALDFSVSNGDPRYKRIYDSVPSGGGTYVGSILGSQTNPPGSGESAFGPGVLKSVDQLAILMSAAESYLLQAEATLKGWLTGTTTKDLFESGVTASFNYLGTTGASTYLAQTGNKNTNYAACTTDAERLACIIRQKWVANNTVTPFEAWCDYRRLGLPADIPMTVSQYAVAPVAIPKRIVYPTSEYQTNEANVTAQGTITGQSKIFWMP